MTEPLLSIVADDREQTVTADRPSEKVSCDRKHRQAGAKTNENTDTE
jgi:hypothetical protein